MPTDPYIAPDPADRPRQQQNLPAGSAMPPAARWRAVRPGDVGPEPPRGPLFGAPGPNVGYAYTLAERARPRLRTADAEHLHDVLPVVAEIAGRRAASFGRAPVIRDVDVAAGLLGYDGSADPEFVEARTALVHGAGHDYVRRRAIVDAVPDELLRLPPAELRSSTVRWRQDARVRLLPEIARPAVA